MLPHAWHGLTAAVSSPENADVGHVWLSPRPANGGRGGGGCGLGGFGGGGNGGGGGGGGSGLGGDGGGKTQAPAL